MKYFETRFLEEADEFISGLDSKIVKKSFKILTSLNIRTTQNF